MPDSHHEAVDTAVHRALSSRRSPPWETKGSRGESASPSKARAAVPSNLPMPHLVVKRKQPPPFHTIYPAPDPADPFAPLSVLRSRASTSLLDTYPLPYTDSTSDEGSTDAEPMVILAVERPEGTTAKMARYLSPRNVRSRSLSQARTPPGKRLHKLSISPPMNFKHLSSADPTIPQHSFFTKEPDDSFLGSCTLADPCQPTQAHSSPSSHARNSVDTIRSVSNALPTSSTSPFSSDSSLTSPQSMPIHLITPSPVPHPTLTSSTTVPIVTPRRRDSYHYHNRRLSRLSPSDVEWAIPTRSQLAQASLLPVITESGLHVSFGSLFQEQRTIVIFIRHFWCPFCQDYMTSLTSLAHPDMMFSGPTAAETKSCNEQDRVQLVVISNGAHTLISKYKRLFALPFSVYTDPSLALYTALGMGVAGQRNPATPPIHAALHEKAGSKEKAKIVDGGYARHGVITGLAMVIGRAIKVGMPVWGNCGDVRQLGGEFILGPG